MMPLRAQNDGKFLLSARFFRSLCDIFRPNISRIDGFIVKRVSNYSTVSSLQQANFLRECVSLCDGARWFVDTAELVFS